MSDVQLQTSLRHAFIPMERHGKNPYNENLWRVVWAPSRMHTLYQVEVGMSTREVICPKYRNIGDAWILERWIDGYEFARMSKEVWDATMQILGPWRERGEYEHAHTFEMCTPEDANVDKLVMWIEEGRKRAFREHQIACKAEYEQEDKDIFNERDARIRNLLPAFGTTAMAGYGGGRGTKADPIRRIAEETGKPLEEGFTAGVG